MAKRLSDDIECFWSSDELDDDVLAIDFLFDKYPKAHWVDEIELPDNVSGVVYTQCDDDDNIGRVTVSYIDEFVNSKYTDKINVNGYNLKKLVLDAYKSQIARIS